MGLGLSSGLGSSPILSTAPALFSARATRTDGVDEHTDIGNSTSLHIGTSDFSISAWVKLSGTPEVFSAMIGTAVASTGDKKYLFGFQNLTVRALIGVGTGGTWGLNLTGGTSLTVGVRAHLCLTLDRDGNGIIYFDGVNDGQGAMTGDGVDINEIATYFLGQGDSGNHYPGDTDEISIWNKNLTPSEVTDIYNSGVPNDLATHSATANLLSWWRMGDGDTFPTITDNKGSNDGTMINMDANNFVTAST